jgi:hypothetical protein
MAHRGLMSRLRDTIMVGEYDKWRNLELVGLIGEILTECIG